MRTNFENITTKKLMKIIDVWSPDTDVLILLMDLAASNEIGDSTPLKFLTGKGEKYRQSTFMIAPQS